MEFQKTCWGGPSALEVLMVGLVFGIPLLLRLRRQGFLLPAASFPFLSPEQFDAVLFAMFVEGAVHVSLLGIAILSTRAALTRRPLPALALSRRTRSGAAEGGRASLPIFRRPRNPVRGRSVAEAAGADRPARIVEARRRGESEQAWMRVDRSNNGSGAPRAAPIVYPLKTLPKAWSGNQDHGHCVR